MSGAGSMVDLYTGVCHFVGCKECGLYTGVCHFV